MLAKGTSIKPSPQTRSEVEQRLISQVIQQNQYFRHRTDMSQDHEGYIKWNEEHQDQLVFKDKWQAGKDSQPPFVCTKNMEYFSEIYNQDQEDDSLFDDHNNFLVAQKPSKHQEPNQKESIAVTKAVRKDNGNPHLFAKSSSNQQSRTKIQAKQQILKERNYVYRKESMQQPKRSSNAGLPPRSKMVNSKSSNILSKYPNRKSISNTRQQINNKQIKTKSNTPLEDYLMNSKPQEPEDLSDNPNQFKFHTFQTYLQNQPQIQQQPKKYTKNQLKYHNQELQCTFKPTILKKSEQLAKSTVNVVQRLSASRHATKREKKPYQPPQSKQVDQSRIERLSQPRRLKTQGSEKIEELPSFRPSLSKKSLLQMQNCTYDVATRNQLWLQQKEERIQKMRIQEELQKQRKENCTHSPSLCGYKGDNNPNLSKYGRQGLASYFDRVTGFKKNTSRIKLQNDKQNRQAGMNMSKEIYSSKASKKQQYDQAVKQLHSRIMGLKI